MVASRTACPSCRHRLSPLTLECPVCGFPVSRPQVRKPLLFQVSKGGPPQRQGAEQAAPKFISSPALGRIAPIDTGAGVYEPRSLKVEHWEEEKTGPAAAGEQQTTKSILWRLALMEFHEALSLLLVNGLVGFVACWQLKLPFRQAYSDLWPYFAAMHSIASWAYLLLPLLLTGSTASMLYHGFGIADSQLEKRISFSLFMLLSVALLPFSLLCMAMTPAHVTLAELLTGQEIRERTPDLLRKR